jgi:hypothetical protein
LCVCNFLDDGDLSLRNLLSIQDTELKKENLEKQLPSLMKWKKHDRILYQNEAHLVEMHRYIDNLFNLRDKYVAHRDHDWHSFSQDFPDDIFNIYLKEIESILEVSFNCKSAQVPPDISKCDWFNVLR